MSRRAEQAAQDLLVDLGITELPVPVEEVARLCGAAVTRERFRRDLSGMLVRDDDGDGAVIGVNSTHHPRRQRFTVAHEIGHLRLHKGRKLTVDSGLRVDYRDDAGNPTILEERDANAFAAALLMPEDAVKAQARPLVEAGTTRSALVSSLARTFEVSEEAMGYRLLNLGFLSY
jgi:Zn-dependent peptidase ImmA (M78 family)